MKMRQFTVLFILAIALVIAPQAFAQTTTVDFELGYQQVDITGNEDMYRSQLNEDDGFVLRDFSLMILNPESDGFYDRLRINASGFGGNPSGNFRLDAGLAKNYRVKLNYSRYETFNALLSIANPFLEEGVVPGQHTWERDRESLNFEIELMPGRTFTPILGYRWNRYDGPRNTTFHEGQEEFLLNSDLEETEEEYYVGLTVNTHGFSGTLMQGWRNYESRDALTLAPGAGAGNNDLLYFGQEIYADSLSRSVYSEADTPVTTFHLTGPLGKRVQMRTSYVRANSEAETTSYDMLSGSLVSFRINHFFTSMTDTVASLTESPSWRGDFNLDIDLTSHFNVNLGFVKHHRELEGWALVSSLYMGTMTLGGLETGDIATLVEIQNATERDEQILNLKMNFVDIGSFTFWAGGSINNTDLDITQDVAEIVVQGGQEGSFDREITSYFLGAAADIGKAKLIFDLQNEEGNEVIMRTDFTNRDRYRLRLKLPLFNKLELLGTAERIESDTSGTDIGYEVETKHYAVDLGYTPTENLTFRLTWDSYCSDSMIPYRNPQDFEMGMSLYSDEGTLLEGLIQLHAGRFDLDAGYSTFENEGTFELELNRIFARVSTKLTDHISAAVEYENHDYSEEFFGAADFESDRIGIFIRYQY